MAASAAAAAWSSAIGQRSSRPSTRSRSGSERVAQALLLVADPRPAAPAARPARPGARPPPSPPPACRRGRARARSPRRRAGRTPPGHGRGAAVAQRQPRPRVGHHRGHAWMGASGPAGGVDGGVHGHPVPVADRPRPGGGRSRRRARPPGRGGASRDRLAERRGQRVEPAAGQELGARRDHGRVVAGRGALCGQVHVALAGHVERVAVRRSATPARRARDPPWQTGHASRPSMPPILSAAAAWPSAAGRVPIRQRSIRRQLARRRRPGGCAAGGPGRPSAAATGSAARSPAAALVQAAERHRARRPAPPAASPVTRDQHLAEAGGADAALQRHARAVAGPRRRRTSAPAPRRPRQQQRRQHGAGLELACSPGQRRPRRFT